MTASFLHYISLFLSVFFVTNKMRLPCSLGQRKLRQALAEQEETVPNQLGKPTQPPTLRLIFQTLRGIHWVVLDNCPQIINLTLERERLLGFFGATTCQYYLLS
jgi:hypothetical protein